MEHSAGTNEGVTPRAGEGTTRAGRVMIMISLAMRHIEECNSRLLAKISPLQYVAKDIKLAREMLENAAAIIIEDGAMPAYEGELFYIRYEYAPESRIAVTPLNPQAQYILDLYEQYEVERELKKG